MEDDTCFNLEKALLAWKQDCASRPGISPEDARELESHVRECVEEFQRQGLSVEQAFHEALRQVGSPREIAHEFARENPLAVWRDRLFWMAMAAFALSVWAYVTNGIIFWGLKEFSVFLPFGSWAFWASLAGHLPVLAVAALLATGRLGRPLRWMGVCMQSRPRFASVGAACMVVGALGQFLWASIVGSLLLKGLFFLDSLLWPAILLGTGTLLLRPLALANGAGSTATPTFTPAAVWRDRVFWMAVGGLLVGFWRNVTRFGITALFYTGDINRPYEVRPLVLAGMHTLILVSPFAVAAWFVARYIRRGGGLPTDLAASRWWLLGAVPAMVCTWAGLYMWTNYLWQPRGVSWPWSGVLMQYATNLQWLWPMGLAALVLWLAPRPEESENAPRPA